MDQIQGFTATTRNVMLQTACENNDHVMMQALLMDPNVGRDRAIYLDFVLYGRSTEETFLRYVELNKDLSFSALPHLGCGALWWCCRRGWAAAVQKLLAVPGIDPAARSNEALNCACANGCAEVIRVLLKDARVNPTYHGHEPLLTVCSSGNTDAVKALLEDPRVDPSAARNSALLMVCEMRGGSADVVRLLLEDSRVNPSAIGGVDPFLTACQYSNSGVVLALLEDKRVCKSENLWRGVGEMLFPSTAHWRNTVPGVLMNPDVDVLEVRRRITMTYAVCDETTEYLNSFARLRLRSMLRRAIIAARVVAQFRLFLRNKYYAPGSGRGFKRARASFEQRV